MARFHKKQSKGSPGINTASLPDIIFMLLFFFMVTTVMRETDLKVTVRVPEATEIKKLEKKSLVSYIYIGKPHRALQKTFGSEPRIQLNDQLVNELSEVAGFVKKGSQQRPESERRFITISLKVDELTPVDYVSDVKQELRKSWRTRSAIPHLS